MKVMAGRTKVTLNLQVDLLLLINIFSEMAKT